MRIRVLASAAALALTLQIVGSAQEQAPAPRLQLAFEGDGTVTLVSNGATLREILAEWTRKGGTPFPGAERLAGGAMALQFDKMPEAQVLNSLLRSAAGYIVGPRREGSAGASQFEVVYVVATSNATASSYTPSAYTPPQPQFSTPGSPDQEIPRATGPGGQPATPAGQSGAVAGQPNPSAPPAPSPGVRPSGVAVPVVPVVPVTSPPPTTGTGRGGGGGGGGGSR
jgi:hypothetical protein